VSGKDVGGRLLGVPVLVLVTIYCLCTEPPLPLVVSSMGINSDPPQRLR